MKETMSEITREVGPVRPCSEGLATERPLGDLLGFFTVKARKEQDMGRELEEEGPSCNAVQEKAIMERGRAHQPR
jgi:hypothetical protein